MRREGKRPDTAGTQFKVNVKGLVEKLEACHPHYIRCIKSNEVKKAFILDDERVRHQSRYLNLIETCRVRRAGFCNKQHYDRFLRRYKMVTPTTWPTWRGSDKDGVMEILKELSITDGECKQGTTKLFTRNATTLIKFEDARAKHLPNVITIISRYYRGYLARQLRKRLKVVRDLTRLWLGKVARKYFRRLRAAWVIQYNWRGYRARVFVGRKRAAITIQKHIRGYQGRKHAIGVKTRASKKAAAILIQRHWQGYKQRNYIKLHREQILKEREESRLRKKNERVTKIQARWRGKQARVHHARLLASIKLQKHWRGRAARVFVKRLKAAIRLQICMRAWWKYRYVTQLGALAKAECKEADKNFGKTFEWPKYQPAPIGKCEPIFLRWHLEAWAYRKATSLSKGDEELMRQKVTAYGIFHGSKRWEYSRPYTADYMDIPENPTRGKFHDMVVTLLQQGQQDHILFTDEHIHITRKFKGQRQVVMVTDKFLYRYVIGKYKKIKEGVPLDSIREVILSPYEDSYVVVKMDVPHRDLLLDMGISGSERYSELVTCLVTAIRDVAGKKLLVNFSESATFNNSRGLSKPGVEVGLSFSTKGTAPTKINSKLLGSSTSQFAGKGATASIQTW